MPHVQCLQGSDYSCVILICAVTKENFSNFGRSPMFGIDEGHIHNDFKGEQIAVSDKLVI